MRTPPFPVMIDLERIRSDLEEFTTEIDREYYLNGAGLKDKLESSRIYRKFSHLFNRDTIDQVYEYGKTVKGEDERRLRYLRAFLVSDYMENRVKELSDKFLTEESGAIVDVEGETMSFRQSAIAMANESDGARRSVIFDARNKVIEGLNPILEERVQTLHGTARELGYANYAALYEDTKGINLIDLESILRPFLQKTQNLYTARMGELIREKIGISLIEAEKHDTAFAFRAGEFDRYFRKEDTVKTLIQTLAGLGIDVKAQKNIQLDIEERPRKSPRAFVAPIRIPGDIRLVIMPRGGHDDYATLFHEAGHAQHLGTTRADLPVEYRYLGDKSLTEGFAFLMEYLVTNSHWLRKFTEMQDPDDFLRFVYLYKLYFLRRYAAKLSYELVLHKKGLEEASDKYKETLESSLVFRHPGSHYLTDLDDGFYCANYLRAWIFEAQIKKVLVQNFGENWFEKRGAGIQLQKWWSMGQKYRVEEMLRDLGYKDLDLTLLVEEINGNLK